MARIQAYLDTSTQALLANYAKKITVHYPMRQAKS